MLRKIPNHTASRTNAVTALTQPCTDRRPPDANIPKFLDAVPRPDLSVVQLPQAEGATAVVADNPPTVDASSPCADGMFESCEGHDDEYTFISAGNEFPIVPVGNLTGHLTPEMLSTIREEVGFFERSAGTIAAIDVDGRSDRKYRFALHFVRSLPMSREEIPQGLERARDHLGRILHQVDLPAMTRALVEHTIELLWRASDTLSDAVIQDEGELCRLVSVIHLALKQLPISVAGQQERIVQKLLSARDAVRAVPEQRSSTIEYLARVLPEIAVCTSVLPEEDIAAVLDAPDRQGLTIPVNDVLQRFSLKRGSETTRKLIDKCRVKRGSNNPT